MCGIAGIFSKSNEDNEYHIATMTMKLHHRGPDASGIFMSSDKQVMLGHTRLSIIDLDNRSDQPFHSTDGRYVIVYNGEIYNFKNLAINLSRHKNIAFKTTSDTEVLLEAFIHHGKDVANLLDGMFAFVVYDRQLNILHLFRDRIGKKPLFYFFQNDYFAFASEIKSLISNGFIKEKISVDKNRVLEFLHLGYIPEPHTIYKNVYKFPSGHSGTIDRSFNLSLQKYWNVIDCADKELHQSTTTIIDEFASLLTNAVTKRLISDVPLGTFLSGGIDSSLITSIASRVANNRLKTFNIGFKEEKFDESSYAILVANELNTEHHTYMLSEKEAIEMIEPCMDHFDEPFADTSGLPTMLVSRLARQEIKVALTGDGGDELFQGYGSYHWADRLDSFWWRYSKGIISQILLKSRNSRYERIGQLLRPVEKAQLRSHIFSQEQYFFSQTELTSNLAGDFGRFEYNDPIIRSRRLSGGEKQALFDLQYYLKDDLLVKVDRASMYYGLECRCPLLDHKVIEFALKLDQSFKVKKGRKKVLLKDLLAKYLPQNLINKPKWGFSIPLAKWLNGSLHYLVDDYLNEEVVKDIGLFDYKYISKLKNEFLNDREYLFNRIWVLIVLHKWLKKHG